MKMEFSAGGIVYRKTNNKFEFALILDLYGKWTFPKGHIETKEKPEEAALREIEEEIGLKNTKIIEPLEKIDYWFKFDTQTIHKYVYFYLVETCGEEELVHQVAEVTEAKWFTPDETMNTISYPEQNQPILIKAFEKLGISLNKKLT